jgi:hypothetical protein
MELSYTRHYSSSSSSSSSGATATAAAAKGAADATGDADGLEVTFTATTSASGSLLIGALARLVVLPAESVLSLCPSPLTHTLRPLLALLHARS